MRTIEKITAGIFAGLMAATPVWADSESACLQHNRAWNWRPVDDKTLIYSDRQGNDYTVTFRNACRNLTRGDVTLVNRHWSGLRCLSSGDSFRVAARGTAVSTCRVESVKAGTP